MKYIKKLFAIILIFFVRIYQYAISPLFPSSCRFQPTCSAYMVEAIQVYGPIKGTAMGLKRISRCHPRGGSGYDPVIKKEEKEDKSK